MARSRSLLIGILAVGLAFTLSRALAQRSAGSAPAAALGSAFTYQGQLRDGASTANGSYDLTFRLYDAPEGGAQISSAVALSGVLVRQGLFAVQLDFGPAAFQGDRRYLEVQVGGTVLSPRQALTTAPYALHAQRATDALTATNALAAASVPWSGISGVPADLADGDDVGASSITWNDVISRPAGLDDGDDDTRYTAGPGLELIGNEFRAVGGQATHYANIVVVAKSGGDFTSVQAALNSITTASTANPFLVYVAPGVYVEQVTLKPFVTLEGSGERTTIVRWTGAAFGSSSSDQATMIGATNATVRSLSIESVAQGDVYPLGLYNNSSSPTLHNITITATGGHASYGMYNESSSPTLTDVSITATQSAYYNTGMYNTASSPTLTRVKIVANGPTGAQTKDYALTNYSASAPIIKDSLISGRVSSIEVYNATAKVVNSQLIGNVDTGLTCLNNYNANFGALTCP